MEANNHNGARPEAVALAEAVKRMAAADNGEMAERLTELMRFPFLLADNAIFFALFGCSLRELLAELKMKPPGPPGLADSCCGRPQ